MQGNILLYYPVMLPSQVILLSDTTSVSTFHMQGNILLVLGVPAILPSGEVIAVSSVTVVRIRYNKTIVAPCPVFLLENLTPTLRTITISKSG